MSSKTWGIINCKGYVVSLSEEVTARKYCDEWNNLDGMASLAPYRVAEFVEVENDGRPRIGDKVRVVNPENSYGDYTVGSEGIVNRFYSRGVYVDWCKPYFNDARDNKRADLLFDTEYEVVRA